MLRTTSILAGMVVVGYVLVCSRTHLSRLHASVRREMGCSSIVARERNPERRDFYELCWHLGGSQSDIAALKAEDFDYVHACRSSGGRLGTSDAGARNVESHAA